MNKPQATGKRVAGPSTEIRRKGQRFHTFPPTPPQFALDNQQPPTLRPLRPLKMVIHLNYQFSVSMTTASTNITYPDLTVFQVQF